VSRAINERKPDDEHNNFRYIHSKQMTNETLDIVKDTSALADG